MKQIPQEFLREEVRQGFMVPSQIKQAWAAALEVLFEIDRICSKFGIKYFADWGTLIGAVRHGGFIPWDDDLDIVMKREDFNQFMEVAPKELSEGFAIRSYRNRDDVWQYIACVINTENTNFSPEHLQKFHNFPYIVGIDIFVLDYVFKDKEEEKKRRQRCLFILAVADSIRDGELDRRSIEENLKRIERESGAKLSRNADPIEMARILYAEAERQFALVSADESDRLVQMFPWGLKGTAREYPKEYYSNEIRLPFEMATIPVPTAYDRMLRDRYGNYLKIVKNGGAHGYPFFETSKRQLMEVMDFGFGDYEATISDLTDSAASVYDVPSKVNSKYAKGSLKETVSECINELKTLTEKVNDTDNICNCQQLAIDLGNLIESVKGEGHPCIAYLEDYCERLFNLFQSIENTGFAENKEHALLNNQTPDAGISELIMEVNQSLESLVTSLKTDLLERKQIMFCPVHASDWKSMQDLFQNALTNAVMDVYVMPLSYFYKDYDGSGSELINEAEDFPNELMCIDCASMTEEMFSLLHPEIIVIDNGYDEFNPVISVHPNFYSQHLKECTDELVFVTPYMTDSFGKNDERDYHNLRYYAYMPGIIRADRVILKDQKLRDTWIEYLKERISASPSLDALFDDTVAETILRNKVITMEEGMKELFGHGQKAKSELPLHTSTNRKNILYVVSAGCIFEYGERAVTKIRFVLELLRENRDRIDVTWTVYPSIEFLSKESKIATDILALADEFESDSIRFDNAMKIEEELRNIEKQAVGYDAFYGDGCPMVGEMNRAGIPVMVQNYEV